MSDFDQNYNESVSAGGIVMIVVASVGVLTAVTTIICLFVTSKRRSRINCRLESVTTRTSPRSGPENSRNSPNGPPPNLRTIIPMFPDLNELAKNPPTYDEAMRLPTPLSPTAPQTVLSNNEPRGTPPPAFDEVSIHEFTPTSTNANVNNVTVATILPVVTVEPVKMNSTGNEPDNGTNEMNITPSKRTQSPTSVLENQK